MKKIVFIFVLISMTLTLASCDFLTQPFTQYTAPDHLQALMISTRDDIRESNVGVTTTIYRNGPFKSPIIQTGSGVIFHEDDTHYYALTNFHVINQGEHPSAEYKVNTLNRSDDSQALEAELLFYDDMYDLAVLKFEKGDYIAKLIDIYERLDVALLQGEFLMAVGNPSGIDAIVTFGEFISMMTIEHVEFRVIYHSVMIYHGNSGGALVDVEGNLVGINTWGTTQGNSEGMAVPLPMIHDFLNLNEFFEEVEPIEE